MNKLEQNFINGVWKPSSDGNTFENINPADTRDVVGRFAASTPSEPSASSPLNTPCFRAIIRLSQMLKH